MAVPSHTPVQEGLVPCAKITGGGVMVTVVVTESGQFCPRSKTYFTVYVPGVLNDGVTEPVVLLILSPAGVAEKVPPWNALKLTGCGELMLVQYVDGV